MDEQDNRSAAGSLCEAQAKSNRKKEKERRQERKETLHVCYMCVGCCGISGVTLYKDTNLEEEKREQ